MNDTVVTTTSITTVSVSMRSAQSMASLPDVIQLAIGMTCVWSAPKPTMKNAIQERNAQTPSGTGGRQLGVARADPRAEQPGDKKAEQRQEDDQFVHARLSPSAR